MIYDVTIIGGGIVGLSTGYQLKEANPDLKVCIIEKETDVAQHQTKTIVVSFTPAYIIVPDPYEPATAMKGIGC